MNLFCKPGGHGVIWKLASQSGAFEWLKKQKCSRALVRQINNPIAGFDQTLIVLLGEGFKKSRDFGFVCSERLVNSTEGMVILIEEAAKKGFSYKITNIEYTDFKRQGIQDIPEGNSPFSQFPANTNILFVNLSTAERLAQKHPIPGLLINLKSTAPVNTSAPGDSPQIPAGRLESTMQNIADFLIKKTPYQIPPNHIQHLPTFVIYNKRHKTIAATKKTYQPGQSLQDTPEGALYAIILNGHELLTKCHFDLPEIPSEELFHLSDLPFLFTYHPALGPLYSIITQKIQTGKLYKGAELQLEIAELKIQNLEVNGSLLIQADHVLGHTNRQGNIINSHQGGKCQLKNVIIENEGLEKMNGITYWKYPLLRKESLSIQLKGNAEFYARDVLFKGAHQIVVPNGHRMIATQENGKIQFNMEKILKPTWFWDYEFKKNRPISLCSSLDI